MKAELIHVLYVGKRSWMLRLWSCGTTEVISPRYKLVCLYGWESPSTLAVPKYVQRAIALQRRENW